MGPSLRSSSSRSSADDTTHHRPLSASADNSKEESSSSSNKAFRTHSGSLPTSTTRTPTPSRRRTPTPTPTNTTTTNNNNNNGGGSSSSPMRGAGGKAKAKAKNHNASKAARDGDDDDEASASLAEDESSSDLSSESESLHHESESSESSSTPRTSTRSSSNSSSSPPFMFPVLSKFLSLLPFRVSYARVSWCLRFFLLVSLFTVFVSSTTYHIHVGEVAGQPSIPGKVTRYILTVAYGLTPVALCLSDVNYRRTGFALLYFECATLIMNLSTSVAWYRNPKKLGSLPDMSHDFFPNLHEDTIHDVPLFGPVEFCWTKILDNLILFLALSGILFLLNMPRNRQDVLRRFLIVYGTLQIMRTVTVLLTSVPDASPSCRAKTPSGDDLFTGAASWQSMCKLETMSEIVCHALEILIPIHPISCGDMVFSGHANTALCFALCWHTYYKWVPAVVNVVKTSVWILALTACAMLCATRTHYLLDVVLSLYFSLTVWTAYHRLAIDVHLGHRFISVWMFDQVLLYPFVEYMELPLQGETNTHGKGGNDDDNTPPEERADMNLFELQLMGVHLDEQHELKRKSNKDKRTATCRI